MHTPDHHHLVASEIVLAVLALLVLLLLWASVCDKVDCRAPTVPATVCAAQALGRAPALVINGTADRLLLRRSVRC